MSLSLIKRSTNGAPLTAVQHDTNLTNIETEVNINASDIATKVSNSTFSEGFEGFNGAKGLVSWVNVTNKPTVFINPCLFRASKTDADQTISASGAIAVNFSTENYDYGSVFNNSTHIFTPPVTGIYYVGASVQVSLTSGSPTAVSIIANIKVNGAAQVQATLDNTGTGTRIYKLSDQLALNANDIVGVTVDFSYSGTATWQVDASNTVFYGHRINHTIYT